MQLESDTEIFTAEKVRALRDQLRHAAQVADADSASAWALVFAKSSEVMGLLAVELDKE